MTLPERLLRRVIGHDAASALVGDLEEDAARASLTRAWLTRQLVAHLLSASWLAIQRKEARMRTTLRIDLRDAIRAIRRFPGPSALAFAILTLSIAAATVIFSVVDGVVLRPLPFPEADRLISINGATPEQPRDMRQSPADYYAWRDGAATFEHLAAWTATTLDVKTGETVEAIDGVLATPELFAVLRVQPRLGTAFGEQDVSTDPAAVAVISHRMWQRHFQGAADVVGRTLATPRGDIRVLGVMPPDFAFPSWRNTPVDVWQPLVVRPAARTITLERGRQRYVEVVGRLRDGISLDQARADVVRVAASQAAAHPVLYSRWQVRVGSLLEVVTEEVRGWMLLVLWAVALVVVIACANVANLLLAQSAVRQRDVAVRLALGATRAQIVGGLLLEGLLLSGAAVGAAVLLAFWGLEALMAALPSDIPRVSAVALDMRVLVTAAGASILTALAFSVIPALQASRVQLATSLKDGSGSTPGRARRRWRAAFLVAEVALVSALLVATTLVVASFVRVTQFDLGFARQNLMGVRVTAPRPAGAQGEAQAREYLARAEDALRALPGVTRVAAFAGSSPPLHFGWSTTRVSSGPPAADAPIDAEIRHVSPAYFDTARIAVVSGRPFADADRDTPVAIVDELAAARLFPGRNPLGATLSTPSLGEHVVIGVAANVRYFGPEGATQPQLYLPLSSTASNQAFLVRSAVPPSQVVPAIEATLQGLLSAPAEPPRIDILENTFRELTADRRFNAALMLAFGLLALLIGVAGIYGVTASIVAQQTREIGIRLALGATAGRVVRSVALHTGRLLLAGAAVGLGAAWALSGIFDSLVFGVDPRDALPYAVPFVALCAIGLLAALLPARRASRIDPLIALRNE